MAQNLNQVLSLLAHTHTHIIEAQKFIAQEQQRLTELDAKSKESREFIQTTQERLKELTQLANKQEKDLSELEKNIEKAVHNSENATSSQQADAAQKQLEGLTPRFDNLTEESLEIMETIEELESALKDKQTFLSGLESTSQELKSEVEANIKSKQDEIEGLEHQIESEFLPGARKEFIPDIKAARKKLFNKGPFSPLKGRGCSVCGQNVDSFQFSALERGEEIEFCSGCSRILFINT